MFIGHFAVALAAKKAAPKVSLGTLFISVQLLDLIWPALVLAGVEHVRIDPEATVVTPLDFYDYPISHSLLGTLVWAAMFAILYFWGRKNWLGAGILAMGVASHWFPRPADAQARPASFAEWPRIWDSACGTRSPERCSWKARSSRQRPSFTSKRPTASDRIGTYGLGGLLAFLVLVWVGNIFGEPPPSDTVVAVAANALWLVVAWAYWVDRHRTS